LYTKDLSENIQELQAFTVGIIGPWNT